MLIVEITMWAFIISAIFIMWDTLIYKRYLQRIINRWKRNPTLMDLSLATSDQLVSEISNRISGVLLLPNVNGVVHLPIATPLQQLKFRL
jgi:hypothetical protein